MTHEEFMTELLRPSFVWRAAAAILVGVRGDSPGIRRARKGAPKRMTNAQVEIDDLVLARAAAILVERESLEPGNCSCVPGIEIEMRPNSDCPRHGRYAGM